MTNDLDTVINGLLVDWHRWSSHYEVGKGYPSSNPACRQSRTSRQYDDENGALDAALHDSTMEAFDFAAHNVPQPWLTALQVQARNMASKAQVWSSPRLPKDPQERAVLTLEARNKLMKELAKNGVI